MTILQIDHVQIAMPADHEPDARLFYGVALGLDEVPKPEHLVTRGGCWFQKGTVRIHLGVDPDFCPAKKAHPAFIVDDLAALAQKLNDQGYSVQDDQPLEGFRRSYVFDPFGNRIELMEPSA